MVQVVDIDQAIANHAKWATHLTKAIADARLTIPLATIGSDDQCEFGQWLYGQGLSEQERLTPDYKIVRELHAEFHKTARQIAELAETSSRYEAYRLLYGEYMAISGRLAIALTGWKTRLEQTQLPNAAPAS